jgi:hypothetical protein
MPFVFVSERGAPFSNRGFQAMMERVARAAGFDMKIHPHMLYKLANDGVDTRTIQAQASLFQSSRRLEREAGLAARRMAAPFVRDAPGSSYFVNV